MRRGSEPGVVAIALVGVEPEAGATWWRAPAHMLFGRRGARTAVARAFVGCVYVLAGGDGNGTGCMGRDAQRKKKGQGQRQG